MRFTNPGAEVFVPDNKPVEEALARTTHIGIGAHPDDVEIMAYHGIVECFGEDASWFSAIIVANGSGSPRDGLYAKCTDEQMQVIRREEQKKAAVVGEYGAVALLDYPSSAVKDSGNRDVVDDLKRVLLAAKPRVVYVHNPADKHDTHVASALRAIQAIRELPKNARPAELYGCEVWRDLDWLTDQDKVAFDVASHENLSAALVGVFDSQICGGKRYDLATMGRRRANATYYASHGVDVTTAMNFAMDLTPLIKDISLDIAEFTIERVRRFQHDVTSRLAKLL